MVRYIVQEGDTLGDIAFKYQTSVRAIVKANGIRNQDMIFPGQILRVPTPHYDDNPHYSSHMKYYNDTSHYYHQNDNYYAGND